MASVRKPECIQHSRVKCSHINALQARISSLVSWMNRQALVSLLSDREYFPEPPSFIERSLTIAQQHYFHTIKHQGAVQVTLAMETLLSFYIYCRDLLHSECRTHQALPLRSIMVDLCTLYIPGCRIKAYK